MSAIKIVAIVLIIAGLLGLVYGRFNYTRETQEAKLGPFELTVKDTQTVNVPVWAGVAAIAAGWRAPAFCGQEKLAIKSLSNPAVPTGRTFARLKS